MDARARAGKTFQAGLYLRLSRDDETQGESASISVQRIILRDYAERNGITIVDEYVDDGYSGTNYDRPDFRRMICDIESRRINTVITKDLSRLGRNSAKTSELLEEYFPLMNVRYIAINDGYDSMSISNGTAIATPFMLLVNEMYARDISQKIRSSFSAKMLNGDYVAAFAPYGYRKDPSNKNHLLVDAQSAPVVRAIFEKAANGYRTIDIARELNRLRVPTPAEYRCQTHPGLDISNYSVRREWTSSMICKMLRNSVYLGQTEQGKTTKISFKSKVVRANCRDEWIVVQGTHEPIVSKQLFEQVRQRAVSRRCAPNRDFVNVFSGIAKCADCGRTMTTAPSRKKGSTYNLCCGGYKAYGSGECSNHFIDYDDLYEVVSRELRIWLSLSQEDRQRIVDDVGKAVCAEKLRCSSGISDTIGKNESRITQINGLIKRSFEEYLAGRLSSESYESLVHGYESERDSLERQNEFIVSTMDDVHERADNFEKFFEELDRVQNASILDKDVLCRLIDRIEVGQGWYERNEDGKKVKHQDIKIYYRFIGDITKTP